MKRLAYIMVAISVVLLIGGIALTAVMLTDDESVKEVSLEREGLTESSLKFDTRDMNPGESRGYAVVLHGGSAETLSVLLTFEDATGALSDYLEVDIRCEDYELHGTLTELLEQGKEFTCNFKRKYRIEIEYTLPESVGNEVMGAEAEFTLRIEASRQ